MLAWQEARRALVPGLLVLGFLLVAGEMLIARDTGRVIPDPAVLVPTRADASHPAVLFARALEILVPEAALAWMGLLLEDLRPHGRAVWAAYPGSAWHRALVWLGLTAMLFGLVLLALAVGFQLAAPTNPWMDVRYVLPVVVWVSGIMLGVTEATRSPQFGALVAVLASVGSYVGSVYAHSGHPAWWMLFAASHYPASHWLTENRLVILTSGLLAWGLGAGFQALQRKWGRDI